MSPIFVSNIGNGFAKKKIEHRVVTATDSEVEIVVSTNAGFFSIQNHGTKTGYLGGTGVTTNAYGFIFYPKQAYDFGYVGSAFSLFIILASGETTTIGVLEDA